MSGEDNGSLGSVQDHQDQEDGFVLQTRLRACEACKTRKVSCPLAGVSDGVLNILLTKCDRLDPCSACKALSIPCRVCKTCNIPVAVNPKSGRSLSREDIFNNLFKRTDRDKTCPNQTATSYSFLATVRRHHSFFLGFG